MLKKEERAEISVAKPALQFVRDVVEHPPFRVTINTTLETLSAYLRKFPIDVVPVFKSVFSDELAGVVYPHTALLLKSKKLEARVGEFLNQPIVVKESWRIENAAEILIGEAAWGAVVVDEEGKFVGVITLRGLLSALTTREPKAKSVASVYTQIGEKQSKAGFVKAIERVSKIFHKLVGGEVDGYVVLNREGGVAGILTVWNFVKSRRWYKGAGTSRPIFGRPIARGQSKTVGVARVWRVMSRGVAVVTPESPLEDAARYMAVTGIYVLPVVDKSGKALGAVTAWDIIHGYLYGPKEGREDIEVKKAVERQVVKPGLEELIQLKPARYVTGLRARDVMLADIPTVHVRDTLSRIRKVFLKNGSDILAVIDDDGKVVGFITRRDFLSYIAERSLGYWKRQKGKLLALKEHVQLGERARIAVEEGTAGDVMKGEYPTASEDSTLEEIAYKILVAGTEYVVITDSSNTPIGVVTKNEILKAYKERGRDVRVSEVLTPIDMAKVTPYDSFTSVIRRINAYELDGVVVAEGNDVMGVVTVDDLSLRPIEETLRGEKLVFFTKSGILRKVKTLGKLRYTKAGTLMALDVMKPVHPPVSPDANLKEIIDRLAKEDIVIVADRDGKPLGIVNKMDIVRELARVYVTYAAPEKVAEALKKEAK